MSAPASIARRFLFNVLAWAVVLVIAFPLLWMLLTSVKPSSELFVIPPRLLPGSPAAPRWW